MIQIAEIASEMAVCSYHCDGVINSPSTGQPPRGLIMETNGRCGPVGVIVCGQNPGGVDKAERPHYLNHGAGYDQQLTAWNAIVWNSRYFNCLRQLLDCLDIDGPILWTDVAKCEGKGPPLPTLMKCSQHFLARELDAVPIEWPVIAAGARAFQAVGYMVGKRSVVGIPHPTGPHAAHKFTLQLEKLKEDINHLNNLKAQLKTPGSRIWLS